MRKFFGGLITALYLLAGLSLLAVGLIMFSTACGASMDGKPFYGKALIENTAIWYSELPGQNAPGFIDEDGQAFLTDFGGNMPEDGEVIQVFYDPNGTATRFDDIPIYWEEIK